MKNTMYAVRNKATGLFVAREGDAPPVPYTDDLGAAGLFADKKRASNSIYGLKSMFGATDEHEVVPVRLSVA